MLDQTKQSFVETAELQLREARRAPQESGLGVSERSLRQAIEVARAALLAQQHADGYWSYELEADCTIPAEYILMMHYMDEIDEPL